MGAIRKNSLSLGINVQVLPAKGLKIKLVPDAAQLKMIAMEADIVSVERFTGELEFRRWQKKGISVTGGIFAQITQRCVVSLEPVTSEVREEIDRIFLPEGSKLLKPKLDDAGEQVVDYDGRDEPELFGGITLDAWEIAMEHFILGIDPFPRKDGAEFQAETQDETSIDTADKVSPFAALKDMFKPK